eukprot:g6055.t1
MPRRSSRASARASSSAAAAAQPAIRKTPAQAKGKGKKRARASPAAQSGAAASRAAKKRAKSAASYLGDIKAKAKCPVCLKIQVPIYQCPEGHIVCGQCKDQLSPMRCPTCRVDMTNRCGRNRIIEELAEALKSVPCRWAHNGCTELFHEAQEDVIEEHALECCHREAPCPLSGEFPGVPLSGFVEHMVSQHGATKLQPSSSSAGGAVEFDVPGAAALARKANGRQLFACCAPTLVAAGGALAVLVRCELTRRQIEVVAPYGAEGDAASGRRPGFKLCTSSARVEAPACPRFSDPAAHPFLLGGTGGTARVTLELTDCAPCFEGPPGGVQVQFSLAEAKRLGFTAFHDVPYDHCTSQRDLRVPDGVQWVLVGAKQRDAQNFALCAFGQPREVFGVTESQDRAREHHGTYWYNLPEHSFGFAPDETIRLSSADTHHRGDNDRLSWHNEESDGGWRAGSLNEMDDNLDGWRKCIWIRR